MLIQKEKEIKSLDPIWISFHETTSEQVVVIIICYKKKTKKKRKSVIMLQKKIEISQIWHGVSKSLPVHLLYC